MESEIKNSSTKLTELEQQINDAKSIGDIDGYNSLVDIYNGLLKNTQQRHQEYNERIKVFNEKVGEYNKKNAQEK